MKRKALELTLILALSVVHSHLSSHKKLSISRFLTLKKVIILFLILATFVLALSAWSLGSQISEAQKKVSDLQNQITYYENMMSAPVNVTFTDISLGPWYVQEEFGPPPYYKAINLTLQNGGTRDTGGLTLKFKVEGPITINDFAIYVNTWDLGILHVQEQKSLIVRLVTGTVEREQALSRSDLTITLMLDEAVLDEQSVRVGLVNQHELVFP
jgi:hypothetical protein